MNDNLNCIHGISTSGRCKRCETNEPEAPETPKGVSGGETPRTDVLINEAQDVPQRSFTVPAEFARALERENQHLQLRAEWAEKAGGFCKEHKPDGGARNCLVCACEKLSATLSAISYQCGQPNEMEQSEYDTRCDEREVLKQVISLHHKLAVVEQKYKDREVLFERSAGEDSTAINFLSQQNQKLREALEESLIWYNNELTNSTELNAKYRELRDILVSTTPSTDWVKKCDVLELKEAIDEYIALLLAELHEVVALAHAHGWASTRFDAGEKCRAKIAEITKKHLGETQSLLAQST